MGFMGFRTWRSVLGAATLLFACSSSREDDPLDSATGIQPTSGGTGIDPSGAGETSEVLDVGGGGTGAGGSAGDDDSCACQNVQDGIYVLNTNTPPSVWFFDPPANTFTQVGVLGCAPPASYQANSMAIDRQGFAWVNYYDQLAQAGKVYRAPLSDLSQCTDLGYQNPNGTWWLLGMGYATVDPMSSCDELFIYNSDRYLEYPNFTPGGSQLGEYDESINQVAVIGPTDYPVAELTGTGDGRLFAFAALSAGQAALINLDKDTGAEIEKTPLDLDITNAFAFGFWGGDVYFFTETAPLSGVSKVTRLDYDGNEGGGLTTYNADTGIHIAGAGVSTCASFTPPA